MIKIDIAGLTKSYVKGGNKLQVLDDISISLEDNEFISVVGPSGCGKSTLLRILAGYIPSDSGSVNISGTISYMQQRGPLMPWRNIYRNVSLPLEIRGEKSNEYENRVYKLIREFGLQGFEKHMPHEISGGMAKRAALVRTYLEDSDTMLLDEPFASLDAITKKQMQQWLLDVWNSHKKSVIFVTHDIEEALFMSDKVYVLGDRPSRILECIKLKFKRPRNYDIVYSTEFINNKKHIEEILLHSI